MWRTRAVIAMLVEDVAGLPRLPSAAEVDAESEVPPEIEPLERAMRRARLVVVVDCLALLVLFVFRDPSRPFLPFEPTIETVFTLGVLAVAAHAGFRLAQLQQLRSVQRLCTELRERQET